MCLKSVHASVLRDAPPMASGCSFAVPRVSKADGQLQQADCSEWRARGRAVRWGDEWGDGSSSGCGAEGGGLI